MEIYVKEWPNRAATLFTADGEELCTFADTESACAACRAVAGSSGDAEKTGADLISGFLALWSTADRGAA